MTGNNVLTIWLIDESQNDAELLASALRNAGHRIRVSQFRRRKDLREQLDKDLPDLVFCAADIESIDLRACVAVIADADASIPVIAVAAEPTTEMVAGAMEDGARDLVARDAAAHLHQAVARELASRRQYLELLDARQLAREAREQTRRFLEATSDAVAFITEGIHAASNPAYARAFGYELPAQVEGLPFMDFIAPAHQAMVKDLLRVFERGESLDPGPHEIGARRADGSVFAATLHLSGISVDGERSLQVLIPARMGDTAADQALKGLRERHARLERKYQILTVEHARLRRAGRDRAAEGLAETRRAVQEVERRISGDAPEHGRSHSRFIDMLGDRLTPDASGTREAAVACLRLDDYEGLVRELGFRAVDGFMDQIERTVRDELDQDDLVGRFGDGRLAAHLSRSTVQEAERQLERTLDAIRSAVFEADGRSRHLSCSIGVRPVTGSTRTSADELMREAYLMALDTSDSGGDQVLHDRSAGARDAGSESDDAWVQRLRQALDSEGFHLVYQPIAALDGTSPSTYEVRLRLAGGSGEEIPPRVFLPPAERTGLMPQIDRWVADRTLRMVQDQEEIRPGTEFLVKLSGASLREEGLNGWVREVCERARALHVQVLFEVSQAVAENHINVVSKLAPVLSELGSGLVIDHFGAGETALDLLDQVPVNYVKLDDSFMAELDRDKTKRERFARMVEGARKKGILSIAGHVEDARALATLWQLGINFIQGNYVQEPEVVLASAGGFQWSTGEIQAR
ncbi:MAG TPA: EAL domain-containing protein [Gammaproteobacteria bacterium]|nr:EAL domain-containing protein [Gammaproteobacteria bacterium]